MSITYTPATNFGAKDSLPTNDPDKVIKGSEFSTEFVAIQTAFGLAAPAASPTFTGTVTISSVDINGGTIDGVTIGGSSAGAGTFSGLTVGAATGITLDTAGTNEASWTHTAGTGSSVINVGRNSTWGGDLTIQTDTKNRLNIESSGDISFYEDTGTTPKFFWDASAESLGIGTTSPSALADIYDSASSSSNDLFHVRDYLGGGSDKTRLIVKNGGNVGIGTSSPTSALDVTGVIKSASATQSTLYLSNAAKTTGFLVGRSLASNDAQDFFIYDVTAASTRLAIDSSGNVGIGTTGPTAPFHIVKAASGINQATDVLRLSSVDTDTSYYVGFQTQRDNSAGMGLNILTTNVLGTVSEAMRITPSGNVGIGTSSPQKTLDVKGTFAISNSTTSYWDFDRDDSDGSLKIADTGSEVMRIDSSGNVGIGNSSPSNYTGANANNLVVGSNSGNNGITIVGGTAGYSSLAFADSAGAGTTADYRGLFQYNHNTDTLNIFAAGAEAMRIDSSGNLLVGTTSSPKNWNNSLIKMRVANGIQFGTYSAIAEDLFDADSLGIACDVTESICFGSYNDSSYTEHARIDSSGNLLVGTTSLTAIDGTPTTTGIGLKSTGAQLYSVADGGNAVEFRINGTAGAIGSINCSSSATSYNTSSDARLKENIADAEDAGAKVDAIQVRQFDWKADGSHQDYGMIAQELLTVAPEAVSGDPESDDMMGVDYSKLVPMMLKEIQSLRARVAQLEGA